MDRFVCVRLVKANDLDLSLLQFDFDLTFAVFFLNADKTIFGRYGTRSDHQEATRDISISSFREAMRAALQLHEKHADVRSSLEGKRGKTPRYETPRAFPALQGKYQADLDYEGDVVRSCVHCHQVREAERLVFRDSSLPIPDKVLFPWPLPDVVGLHLDPAHKATVAAVADNSPAAAAGFQPGDRIVTLDKQPILSIADVQWVLHNVSGAGRIAATIQRDDNERSLTLELPDAWRRGSDISWRATTWDLRRMGTGGMLLEELPKEERRRRQLADHSLALRVKHLGQFGAHAAAKRAGFQKEDVLVSFDGIDSRMSESELIAHAVQRHKPGDRVPVTVLRGDRRIVLQLPMQ